MGQEGPLEKEMATHYIPLPGESHGQRNLAGYSPWGLKESDRTERLTFTLCSQDICSVVGLLTHLVALFLVFQGISTLFSIVAASVYIPTNSEKRLPFLHTLYSIAYL